MWPAVLFIVGSPGRSIVPTGDRPSHVARRRWRTLPASLRARSLEADLGLLRVLRHFFEELFAHRWSSVVSKASV